MNPSSLSGCPSEAAKPLKPPVKIKLCGLTRPADIAAVNELLPDYIGFVFAPGSRRYISPAAAAQLREKLAPGILPVGVFVNEAPEQIAWLLSRGIIGAAQLHGSEDAAYLSRLRALTDRPLIQAFRMETREDLLRAEQSRADYLLLDSGAGGTGTCFDWSLLTGLNRPFFLAGGLSSENIRTALHTLCPYAVDVSSGIETDGKKDPVKMHEFVRLVRESDGKDFL